MISTVNKPKISMLGLKNNTPIIRARLRDKQYNPVFKGNFKLI